MQNAFNIAETIVVWAVATPLALWGIFHICAMVGRFIDWIDGVKS